MQKGYQDLIAWQRAMSLVDEIYSVTKEMPKSEEFGLKSQMRRAAVSVASNIAEGYRRRSPKEFKKFLRNSLGSAAELETQLIISEDLELIPCCCIFGPRLCVNEVQSLLMGLYKSIK